MTARLPNPGGDDGNWGDILNDFLLTSHNSDGTLQPGAVTAAGGVTLVNGHVPLTQLGSGTASTSNYLRGDGVWAVPDGAGNATTSVPGIVQLDGDLGGTATSPTVSGIQGNEIAPGTPSDGQVLSYKSATSKWTPETLSAAQVSGALQAGNNLSDVGSAPTALGNLGGMPKSGGAFTGAVVPAAVVLTDAATITLDASLGNVFTLTLGGNRTLGAPSNSTAHQMIVLEVTQDASGGRTLAYASGFEFSAGAPAPILSATAGATDYLLFIYSSTAGKWRFLDARLGY